MLGRFVRRFRAPVPYFSTLFAVASCGGGGAATGGSTDAGEDASATGAEAGDAADAADAADVAALDSFVATDARGDAAGDSCATCGGQCVDLSNDPNNCGSCGRTCAALVEGCVKGSCACMATTCPAGGDGGASTCIDTTTDPNNCGGCAMSCAYTCADSQCGPLELAGNADGFPAPVTDGTSVYLLAFPLSVVACAVTGCNAATTPVVVLNENVYNPGNLQRFAVGGGYVFWTTQGEGQIAPGIAKIPTSGGTVTSFATPGSSVPVAVVTDATTVYWSDVQLGILSCPIAATCTSPTTIVGPSTIGINPPQSLAVDSAYVYWTDKTGALYSYPLAGGAKVTLWLPSSSSITSLVASGGRVYWTTSAAGPVYAGLATSGTPTIYYGDGFASGVATDGTNIYWTSLQTNSLRKCAPGAACAAPTDVATGLATPYTPAVDANHTYWVGSGAIDPYWPPGDATILYEFSK